MFSIGYSNWFIHDQISTYATSWLKMAESKPKFKNEHLCSYVDIHKIFYSRSNDMKKKVFMNIKIILLFSDVNLILNGPMWMEGRKRRISGGGVGFPIFWSHIVSPTGIFCASNDDDAWKPHEFYELISPHKSSCLFFQSW